MTMRPALQTKTPPLRHTTSSPQLPNSNGSVTPNTASSQPFPPQKSRQNSRKSSAKPSSSKRSQLPDDWHDSKSRRDQERTPRRRRLPSEKLLARSGSLTNATARVAAEATSQKTHLSPVTVSCRSASVDATTRNKRRKELPLLTPSADTGAWPPAADTGRGRRGPPLSNLNLHAANGKRSLARTGSASSARGFSSLSRNGSAYTSLSRAAGSRWDRADDSNWAEYSHRNSPVIANFKHLPSLGYDTHTDEDRGAVLDDDSDNEPHLANILAPHVSPLPDAHGGPPNSALNRPGPVGRQQSIQSLRACLVRHESRGRRSSVAASRVTSPHRAAFPAEQVVPHSAVPIISLPAPMQPTGPSVPPLPGGDDRLGASLSKRRSMGHFEPRRPHGTVLRKVDTIDTVERGRSGSRTTTLLSLGLNALQWQSTASRSPSHSVQGTRRTARTGSTTARDMSKGKKDKMSKKELETERLLWGTSWGRK